MRRSIEAFELALLLFTAGTASGAESEATPLVEIFEVVSTHQARAWITASQTNLTGFRELEKRPVWRAVVNESWSPGLIPIFAVERRGITELRRRPPRGQENFCDPLFFAVPPLGETNTADLAGRWQIQAIDDDGHRHRPVWELTVEGDEVSGRFDPDTEYRFAFINGGTWRSNRIELRVENVNDHFTLTGELADSRLTGTWRRTDGEQSGTWTGERPDRPFDEAGQRPGLIELWIWQSPETPAPRYGAEPPDGNGRWRRSAQPLCRVWRHGPAQTDGTPD